MSTEITFTLKCCLCKHREQRTMRPGDPEPCCSKCYGPVTVERAESHTERQRAAQPRSDNHTHRNGRRA